MMSVVGKLLLSSFEIGGRYSSHVTGLFNVKIPDASTVKACNCGLGPMVVNDSTFHGITINLAEKRYEVATSDVVDSTCSALVPPRNCDSSRIAPHS